MVEDNAMYTKTQKTVIISLASLAIYFLLKEEAAASEALNLFPSTLPPVSSPNGSSVISLQIVLNSILDH